MARQHPASRGRDAEAWFAAWALRQFGSGDRRAAARSGNAAVTDRIRSVVVVGRDAPLWLASAAVQRALGPSGVKVRAVELKSQLTQVDAYAPLPSLSLLHRLPGPHRRPRLEL